MKTAPARPKGFPLLLLRAALLDAGSYAQVASDRYATMSSLAVVLTVALAHAVGGSLRARIFHWDPLNSFVFGLVGELVFFGVAALAFYLVGRGLRSRASLGRVFRAFGFSLAPGVLILLASLSPRFGVPPEPLLAGILVWRLASGFVALRAALSVGILEGLLTLTVGVATGAAAVAFVSGLLNSTIG